MPQAPGSGRRQTIPSVAFYGEPGEWSTAALLHSELLVERSRLHAWRIRPHRHNNLTQLFWLARGSGVAHFDAERQTLEAPCLAVVPERCVHEFEWDLDSDGFALSIASGLVNELEERLSLARQPLRCAAVIDATGDTAFVETMFRSIHEEYLGDRLMKEIALDALMRSLVVWLARSHSAVSGRRTPASRGSMHFGRFAELLETRHKEQWSVAKYAAAIGISAPHLNAICRQHGGASAQQLIHDRVLLAARRELAYTDKSIADVATSLGFTEPSYFSRFFRRGMHMTPRAFRRSSGTLAGES